VALTGSERQEWIARGTPREWRFWRAFLRARLGEAPADSEFRDRFEGEKWFRLRPPGRLRKPSKAEAALAAMVDRRLAEWAGHVLPQRGDSLGP
jgi:hypothetical protein